MKIFSPEHVTASGSIVHRNSTSRKLQQEVFPATGTVVVTGSTAGLGYYAAEKLAELGYRTVLAARNPDKAESARQAILKNYPEASVDIVEVDLTDPDSIDKAAHTIGQIEDLVGLLLNAGVVGSRKEKLTKAGFELQIGTGYLGHYRLLARVVPALLESGTLSAEPSSRPLRIVHLGSISHRWIRLSKKHLISPKYRNSVSYARSKLAVMTFGFDLAARAEQLNLPFESVLVHPGFAWDHFDTNVPEFLHKRPLPWWLVAILTPFAQGKRKGAEALVAGITVKENINGAYLGPDGIFYGSKGNVKVATTRPKVRNVAIAKRLLEQTENLTGLSL